MLSNIMLMMINKGLMVVMKLQMYTFFGILLLSSTQVFAQSGIYNFDTIQTLMPASAFENNERVYPKQSDFSIVRAIPMSTDSGERAALVVIKNQASGQRIFDIKQVVAIIGDGTRVYAQSEDLKVKLSGNEQTTVKLEFGKFDYPIVSLYTSESES
ncbi:hypothetical protein J8L98_03080 [Pseudoalteromonas sp. MMG013]|uniref:hypothetical protein n=1 Tax=Pseudoalteromonas sp. MMG013 TaxID=2822687 RepID=UPI001B36BFF1|nr:hypothetical protein [Pseudoalteromonas sp. MMG013]MBQ4860679.1 hypothetical protein [Pseudoalteromonas sp. MMG013]